MERGDDATTVSRPWWNVETTQPLLFISVAWQRRVCSAIGDSQRGTEAVEVASLEAVIG
jgi:hypothetical protein